MFGFLNRAKIKKDDLNGRIVKQNLKLFKHWDIGIKPSVE
jgi:hypothetical protein